MTNHKHQTKTKALELAPEEAIPEPAQFLNYVRDVRGNLGRVLGPMYGVDFDQVLTVVTEDYDEATNHTRLGLAYGNVSARFQGGKA